MAKKSSKKAKKSARKTRPQANRICNVVPSRNTQNDWGIEQAITASALAGPAVAAAPVTAPASIDLRASWWGIGNQETTGSCVGWASTDGVARYHFVKASRLAQNAKLSPRFIWMASKETDEFVNRPETMIEGAGYQPQGRRGHFAQVRRRARNPAAFQNRNQHVPGRRRTPSSPPRRRVASLLISISRKIWRTGAPGLPTRARLLVALSVDATWDNATATQGKLNTFQPNTVRGGHAVCVVGYTTDNRFIIRNSWGTGWGDKGFAYASEAYINAGFFNESYGVSL